MTNQDWSIFIGFLCIWIAVWSFGLGKNFDRLKEEIGIGPIFLISILLAGLTAFIGGILFNLLAMG